jgi:thioredoxin reductase (NADPH)
MVGTQYDTDCREIRAFLAANRIPYEWVDRELEPDRVPSCTALEHDGPAVVIDGAHCVSTDHRAQGGRMRWASAPRRVSRL